MSTLIATPSSVVRPKVYRPPVQPVRRPLNLVPKKLSASLPYAVFSVLFLMLAMSSAPANRTAPEVLNSPVVQAKLVPQISVTPMQERASLDANPNGQANTVVAPTPALPPLTHDDGKSVVLQGHNAMIVGQMAKIPLENEQITEVKPLQEVDNGAASELLSIVSKY